MDCYEGIRSLKCITNKENHYQKNFKAIYYIPTILYSGNVWQWESLANPPFFAEF